MLPKEHWLYVLFFGFPWWLRWWRICLQCRRLGFDPGSGRSPSEGNGYPLQYSCLENFIDGGSWWATVDGLQRVGRGWHLRCSSLPFQFRRSDPGHALFPLHSWAMGFALQVLALSPDLPTVPGTALPACPDNALLGQGGLIPQCLTLSHTWVSHSPKSL